MSDRGEGCYRISGAARSQCLEDGERHDTAKVVTGRSTGAESGSSVARDGCDPE